MEEGRAWSLGCCKRRRVSSLVGRTAGLMGLGESRI